MPPPRPKTVETLANGLRRVLADNPSPMTHWGTNSYILGEGRVAVIDPGPALPGHLDNILGALQPGETVSHIFVTHSHVDHSLLAAPLSRATGAPILAYGHSAAGRSQIMHELDLTGLAGGGEGVDRDFAPQETLGDGDTVHGDGWSLRALWTPGHMGNHLSFQWDDVVFTGDHIMGWASSLVSPPDGDLTDFMASTRRLAQTGARVFHAGHGAPIEAPRQRANWLLDHRTKRETMILNHLVNGPADAATLAAGIYTDTPPALLPAAERNVFAHLIDMVQKSLVTPDRPLAIDARFTLARGGQN